MDYLSPLLFGIGMVLLGLLFPGMVNMGAVSLSMKRGLRAGLVFSIGAAVAMAVQAYIAVAFAGYLGKHPEVFLFLKRAAVVIFLGLSIVFLYQALKPRVAQAPNRHGHPIWIGVIMAGMNALNIPYFFTASTYLKAHSLILWGPPFRLLLVGGVLVGAWGVLSAYAYFAQFIASHAVAIARNINFFLSGFFLLLAFVQMGQLYMG